MYWLFFFLLVSAFAGEKAAYDSNGRIIALITGAEDIEASTNIVAVLPSGRRIPVLARRDGRGAVRQGDQLAWTLTFQLPDGGRGTIALKSEEGAAGVMVSAEVTAETPLDIAALEWTLDLPRPVFLNGRLVPANSEPVPLTGARALSPVLYKGETAKLNVTGRDAAVEIVFDQQRSTTVLDRWDDRGRSYQLRTQIRGGAWESGAAATFSATLRASTTAPSAPVNLALDTSQARFRFDGFGGNYCWNNESPIADYTMKNLMLAWTRTEMKAQAWDKERDHPGRALRADFERMRALQQLGARNVISIWWLPERFYTDPFEKPRSAHFRLIDPRRWDELLDLLGSYLLYAKREYNVEPELFSFNEANIGVYVGLTPETHTEAIKRIGAHFAKLGLKTKMLLGDATGPRDTHKFVLEAAADPEAMRYVGAVGFHSWGGGTPEQYKAWGDVGEWLQLPLLVTELGTDASSYYTRSWDSFSYGLREAQMIQELLIYARPQGTQYWQFTNDYALARIRDGVVQPTARFWIMKHFNDLTPQSSEALGVQSDQKTVLATAFRKGPAHAIHVLNLGGTRSARIEGLPEGRWRVTQSAEAAQYQARPAGAAAGALTLELPARSLVTLTREGW